MAVATPGRLATRRRRAADTIAHDATRPRKQTCSRGFVLPWTTRRPRPPRPGARKAAAWEPAEVDPVARVLVDIAAGPPRPPLRLRRAARRWPTPPCPARGSRCASPARTSTATSSSAPADDRPHRHPPAAAARGERRARARPRDRRAERARSPGGTPAPGPTCCGWPSRPATRPPRRQPSAARRRRRPTVGAGGLGRGRARRGVPPPPRPRASAPRRCGPPRPPTTGRAMVAEAVATTYAAGRGRAGLRARPPRRRPGSTPRSTERARRGPPRLPHRRRRPGGALPRLPGRLPRRPPGRRRHPLGGVRARSTTSAWSCCGTTATTCTPSRARPTPTPARCSSRAPSSSRRPRCSAASPARPRRSSCSRRAGPTSSRVPRDGRCGAGCASRRCPPRTGRSAPASRERRTTPSARGLESGPVLVQTPRAGYAASLACDTCRTPARCTACTGPLVRVRADRAAAVPLVRPRRGEPGRAARAAAGACAPRSGARRAPPRSSAGCSPARPCAAPAASGSLERVGAAPDIVVATVGAEPVADEGYAAVVVLDTWLTLARDDLRASEEALRRWLNAGGARPAGRARRGRRRPGPPGAAGAGALGPGRLRPSARWRSGRRPTCRRRPGWPPSPGTSGRSTTSSTCSTCPRAPRCSGRCRSATTGSTGCCSGCRGRAGEHLSGALGDLQRVRSARKLDPVRIQVDPLTRSEQRP